MISLPITSATAILAGVLILLLTSKVIQLRRSGGVVLGDNDDRVLAKAIRGHANAVEQLPIALIIMGLAEAQGGNTPLLVLSAILLVAGRIMHAMYFAIHGTHWRLRMYGMMLTLIAQGLLVLTLILTILI
ncbi:MAPEG family protein [Yoonia algicola]|uniref:MAPEG family protein n=1 Tax=Yoonia algicola TaxID=3137368 RepID=A0AAN0MCY9_9RHOB